jgi:hypothetical protein
MKFELFCPVYNEEYMLPYMVNWYKHKVGEHNIVFNIYDNGSTDNTVQIAKDLGCNVGVFETGGQVRDDLLMDWKNSIWKDSKADFVIVCDCDEFVDICVEQLNGYTLLPTIGYNMVGILGENPDIIVDGVPSEDMNKVCVFNPEAIKNINYVHGAHVCNPKGEIKKASPVGLYHMKFISEQYIVDKYKSSQKRLSDINKKHGWGFQYEMEEAAIRVMYGHMVNAKKRIR